MRRADAPTHDPIECAQGQTIQVRALEPPWLSDSADVPTWQDFVDEDFPPETSRGR
jgi:hypothetical protein